MRERFVLFLAMQGFTDASFKTSVKRPFHCPTYCKRMLTSSLMKDAKRLLIASRRP